jgi:hypothetical protein
MTDHYEPGNVSLAASGLRDGVLFVAGVETRGNGGSILSVGLREDFEKGALPAERLAALAGQGAVNVLGHVERIRNWDLEPFQGIEIYNLHAGFRDASKLGVFLRALFSPVDAFLEGTLKTPDHNLALWDRELARGRRLAPFAGHDAHANVRVLGATVGTYAQVFRLFSTRVLVRELTLEALMEAMRRGRTIVTFDFLGDAAGFHASYGEPDAGVPDRALPGDTAAHRADHTLDVRIPPDSPDSTFVRVIRDGDTLIEASADHLSMALPGPGIYRVEVHQGEDLWILPSPIWLE